MKLDFRMGGDAISDARVFNRTKVDVEGRKFVEAVAGGTTGGAFYTMRTVEDAVDPAENGDIYLQGGMVSGGTGNVVIDEVLLFDQSLDGGAGEWVITEGQTLIITVTGSGQETSGILDPVFNVSTAVESIGSVAANTLPEVGSTSGKTCYLLLGTGFEGGFAPSGPGNFVVGFCWGNYSINRS